MQKNRKMTMEEAKSRMNVYENIFDFVRLLPQDHYIRHELFIDGVLEKKPEACYRMWEKENPCENCVTRKAFETQEKQQKIDIYKGEVYQVYAEYVEIDEVPHVIELVSRLTDEQLTGVVNNVRLKTVIEEHDLYDNALEEARRANAAKSMFLSKMSHDIRTPLNGIIGLLNINEKHADDLVLLQENNRKAMVAANHLLDLVSDVLEISKLDDQNVVLGHEVFNILKLSEDVLTITAMRAAEAGITLVHHDCSSHMHVPYVCGSPVHVRQILLNIFSNAIKYNKPGGNVTCSAEAVDANEHTVWYRCTISDTGIGMSPEFLEHIFEPFSQEHTDVKSVYQGTGLGMAIVKSLVDRMNGTLEVTSTLGEGSTFVVTIPFEIAAEGQEPEKEMDAADVDISGMRLLVVEDNELNREIVCSVLEEKGAVITEAVDGAQALKLFADNPADTFDAILMDLMMPVMDGLTATRRIRALERPDAQTIPIIAMTANAFGEDIENCLQAGMNAHLAKPLDMDKMLVTLAKWR